MSIINIEVRNALAVWRNGYEQGLRDARRSPPLPYIEFDWRAAFARVYARRDELSELDSDSLLTVTLNMRLRQRPPSLAQMRWLHALDRELQWKGWGVR